MPEDHEATTAQRAPRLNQQVSDELSRRIRKGLIQPGEHLVELKIASELGVSRTPVRSAFKTLERNGLIKWENHRGFVVRGEAGTDRLDSGGIKDHPLESSTPLVSIAAWETIYRDVSRKCVTQAAYGSWRLTETELANEYSVSRTVAREVLGRLEQVGIIRKDHRSRWFLPALTHKRISELYEMRRILEPVALSKAAVNVPRDLLNDMLTELKEMMSAIELPPPAEFDRLERRLHVDVLSYCDNDVLLESLQNYHALLVTNTQLYDATRAAFGFDPFAGEHCEIIESLLQERYDHAAAQMENHLQIALGRALARTDYMVAHRRFDPPSYLRQLT